MRHAVQSVGRPCPMVPVVVSKMIALLYSVPSLWHFHLLHLSVLEVYLPTVVNSIHQHISVAHV